MKYSRLFFYLFVIILMVLFVFLLIWLNIINFDENGIIHFSLGMGNFERFITIVSTAITAFLYIKLRFFDNRLFNRLQTEYSKQKFFDGLRVIIKMLDMYTPEDIINRLCSINKLDLDMRLAVIELEKLISVTDTHTIQDKIDIKLTRKEKKQLDKEIKKLLDILDHNLEAHYLNKRLKLSDKLKYKIYPRTYLDKHIEETRKSGKKHINDNFK